MLGSLSCADDANGVHVDLRVDHIE
jgi:hypothetical protein